MKENTMPVILDLDLLFRYTRYHTFRKVITFILATSHVPISCTRTRTRVRLIVVKYEVNITNNMNHHTGIIILHTSYSSYYMVRLLH